MIKIRFVTARDVKWNDILRGIDTVKQILSQQALTVFVIVGGTVTECEVSGPLS